MKKLSVSILCAAFFLVTTGGNLRAQSSEEGENYYSNPRNGINPTVPSAYSDTSIASKSDDIYVELIGTSNDTTPPKDTTRLKLKSIPEYTRGESPYYWGTSIYYSFDPWYSPYWNGWYYPGWGGSHWMLTYGWGVGPYWSVGLGWSWGWGSPWWYWDPWYSPYYHGYYGYYGWGGYAYGWGHYNGRDYAHNFGHGYLGSGNRGAAISPTHRGTSANPSPARPVRRGGVDLNNGGRAPRGSISGTGTRGNTNIASGSSRTVGSTATNGRYAKPSSVSSNRAANSAARNSVGSGNRSTNSRVSTNSSRFESSHTGSRSNSSYRQSNTSSRSTSSSFRSSSSSSRSSSTFSGSSSRSSGGFSGGSSSRGGGSSHSSSRR